MTPSEESYRLIPLTQGQFTKVDAADYEWLSQWKWFADFDSRAKTFYAAKKTSRSEGPQRTLRMQRVILGLTFGDKCQGDHINHDTLDNRRSNLRVVTNQQNQFNSQKQINSTSGSKGVTWNQQRRKWIAQICVDGKYSYLGGFDTSEEARQAYELAAIRLQGAFANLSPL